MVFAATTALADSWATPVRIAAILASVIVLGLLLWGIKNPLAWVIVSVLAITAGSALLVWGTCQILLLGEQRTGQQIHDLSSVVGGGAGGTIGGLVLLVVSLLRRWKSHDSAVRGDQS